MMLVNRTAYQDCLKRFLVVVDSDYRLCIVRMSKFCRDLFLRVPHNDIRVSSAANDRDLGRRGGGVGRGVGCSLSRQNKCRS